MMLLLLLVVMGGDKDDDTDVFLFCNGSKLLINLIVRSIAIHYLVYCYMMKFISVMGENVISRGSVYISAPQSKNAVSVYQTTRRALSFVLENSKSDLQTINPLP